MYKVNCKYGMYVATLFITNMIKVQSTHTSIFMHALTLIESVAAADAVYIASNLLLDDILIGRVAYVSSVTAQNACR